MRNVSSALALAVIITSVLWKVAAGQGLTLYLVPGDVRAGELWQLLTWLPAAAPDTGSVLFSALIIWSTGGNLEAVWGRRRYLTFLLVVTLLTGLLTLASSFVLPSASIPYFGGNVISSLVWVGYGCVMWRATLNIFGYPLTGRTFAIIGVTFMVLNAVFTHWLLVVAQFYALALTFAYARYGFPGALLERFGSWRLRRRLGRRSTNLRAIDGGQRNVGGGSDKFLH